MRNPDRSWPGALPPLAADIAARLRARHPRVHCITNTVAQAFTANVLLAAGAIPSMTTSPQEIGEFAARADALLINLGTFDDERRAAVDLALAPFSAPGRPWVLDPVLIDVSEVRAAYARGLVGRGPAAVRLNAAEFAALAQTQADAESVVRCASRHKTVIGMTGAADYVTDGARRLAIGNGHDLMGRVTAMGCAASALVAACLAVEPDAFSAAASALLIFGIAGEIAGAGARGPGQFAADFIDAIHAMGGNDIMQRARLT